MGGSAAKSGNAIARASLEESRRQYREQQAEKERDKAIAKANATGSRVSANMAYANNFFQTTDYTSGVDGTNYGLLTAWGTPSIIGNLNTSLGGSSESTLG